MTSPTTSVNGDHSPASKVAPYSCHQSVELNRSQLIGETPQSGGKDCMPSDLEGSQSALTEIQLSMIHGTLTNGTTNMIF